MKKRKGMVLGIVNYSLTLLGITSIIIVFLNVLFYKYDYIPDCDIFFALINILFVMGIGSTSFLYILASIVISIINLIKGMKIFKFLSIINIVLNIVLFIVLRFVVNFI